MRLLLFGGIFLASGASPKKKRPAIVVGSLARSAKVLGAANALGFGISVATGSHVHLDLIGTGAFTVAAAATRGRALRTAVSATCVGAWATRLASFLFFRALKMGHDARLEETLSTVPGAFSFWLVSFAWGWLTMLPHTLAADNPRPPSLGPWSTIAGLLFVVGIATEVSADFQKWAFKQQQDPKASFCNVGVWSVSQHPNYFGNLCLWTGIWLLNVPALLATPGKLVASTLCPLFLTTLFVGQSAGWIGPALELADKKYGALPEYQAYKANTPLIVPYPIPLLKALAAAAFA
ncbi:hypothetical protein CTAYLR_008291 [Chrysophaeum taylorii]|uniref:Steroid 5-alpha reductase C-terminal domain-containing protein n=1 Tax=Chrysophaeum taylorii TaxID=2483200 RepID=A0AAD7U6G7_9STRA|nr:hypothetical protein CTAYLR_008291 [Chrysophaeum taylorii]